MLGQQRDGRRAGSAVLDLAARWFRARARLRGGPSGGEHAHWDPVNRTWQYHVHRRDASSRRG